MVRSSLVAWSGALMVFVALQEPDESSLDEPSWGEPLWRVAGSASMRDGADSKPFDDGLDEQAAFCEQKSLQLMAAAGRMSFDGIHVERPSDDERKRLFGVLSREIEHYPPGFLAQVGLRGVAFTRGTHRGGRSLGGVAFPGGHVILDAETRDPVWVIHHEFFHTIEQSGQLSFDGWEALNPPEFTYQGDAWQGSPKKSPCFVSAYATSNPRDDRAEVFAAMMVHKVPDDACSRAKAQALARSLAALRPRLPAAVVAHLPEPVACE